MLPLRDDVPGRTAPIVTIAIVVANVLVYLYQMSLDVSADAGTMQAAQDFVFEFGAVPCRVTGACHVPPGYPNPMVTIFTSMFLHGGLLHVGGNMLYLWIFGNNVEDTLGHVRFLVFYLLSGVAAALAQILVNPSSGIPMIGASGAVSGVLGAYLLLFPYARVLTLIMFGFFIRFVHVPALVVLGFWIVVQFLNGLVSVSLAGQREAGGVAFFAHVGGFFAGMGLLFLLRPRQAARL